MNHPTSERSAPAWMLSLMLLVSGGCALVFQVVWIRELRLVFGATTASSAAVLAIFMAGLGLGNWLFGRRIDASTRPLRFYGLLELGIACSAGLTPFLILLVREMYLGLGGQAALGPEVATLLRLLASAIILAVPTILMGGTMPAAGRAVSSEADQNRRGVALIYGLNTLGAVVGAGLANFFLLEALGNRSVLWSACLVNLLLAGTALHLSKRISVSTTHSAKPQPSVSETATGTRTNQLAIVCFSSATVGFVFFLMEIVWYRMLGPLLGGTTYTFGLILCIALLGIGIGGALYGLLARFLKPSLSFLAVICVLEALLIAIPFWYGDQIAFWVLEQHNQPITSFGDQVWNWFQVGSFVIFPAAAVAGFQFPLLIAIAGKGRENVGKHVGWTFAANTAGAICGSIAGGFFLLPVMTAPGLWRFSVCLLLALSGIVFLCETSRRKLPTAISGTIALLALLAIFDQGPTAVWRHSGIGVGRAELGGTGPNAERHFANTKKRQCIWEAEGRESSVAITAVDSLAFIVNGKSDGNAFGDAGTQIGLGLLGTILHPSPRTGLVIGLGTGESAGWMADVDEVETVDVVELEPTILEMAQRCAPVNRNALENPKLKLHFNDAREYLLTTDNQYDLIVSEPSNPYRAGIANLYTQEFYESVATRLNEGGLFLQWLQGYEVDDRTVMIVLQTIRSVFPQVQIWRTKSRDMVLVCSRSADAFKMTPELLRQRMQLPTIQAGLEQGWRVKDLEGLFAHYVCGNQTIDAVLQAAPAEHNLDDRNQLEYAFAKTVGSKSRFSIHDLHDQALASRDVSPVPSETLNLETVTQRRQAMQLFLGGAVPLESHLSETAQRRAEAYQFYLAQQYPAAAQRFSQLDVDLECPIESMVYAHTLAETGQTIDNVLLEQLQAANPTEVHAIKAIAHFQQGRQQQALDATLAALKQLKTNPWGSAQLIDSVLRRALALSEADPGNSEILFQHLSEPFALYRLEDKRLMIRFLIAEKLEQPQILAALDSLEPNIPWIGWLLESRAKLYASVQHPRSAQAKQELQLFRRSRR